VSLTQQFNLKDSIMADVTAEEIRELLDSGLSKKEAGEELGISAQKVGSILKQADIALLEEEAEEDMGENVPVPVKKTKAIKGEVMSGKSPSDFAKTFNKSDITNDENITIFTAKEYTEYSAANGRFQGRELGKKTKCSIEELRALINSGLKPKYIMDKHGMNQNDFIRLVYKLSEKELRTKPLKFNFEQDYIQVG